MQNSSKTNLIELCFTSKQKKNFPKPGNPILSTKEDCLREPASSSFLLAIENLHPLHLGAVTFAIKRNALKCNGSLKIFQTK